MSKVKALLNTVNSGDTIVFNHTELSFFVRDRKGDTFYLADGEEITVDEIEHIVKDGNAPLNEAITIQPFGDNLFEVLTGSFSCGEVCDA